ncbi:MAG: hypothetical protein IJR17_07120 [Clostridia bacterium]|nr:hypothetical protein [Clostridia bacterium]
MFHVEKGEYATKTFRLPVELLRQMETVAQNEKVSLNNLVVQCCKYALENLDSNN